jgi:hypothetical protein
MKKRTLFILLAGLLIQPLHAVTLIKKNTSIYEIHFDDGTNFEVPLIKRYLKILENPEGLEIFNIENIFTVQNDNTSTIYGNIKNKNITIKLPKEYKIIINNNSLFIYPQNTNNTYNKNDKIKLSFKWINENDSIKLLKQKPKINNAENYEEEILESGNVYTDILHETNTREIDNKISIDEEPIDIKIKSHMSINRIISIDKEESRIKDIMSIENILN